MRRLLDLIIETDPVSFMTDHGAHSRLLSSWNDNLVRGLVWTTAFLDISWAIPELEKVANLCVRESHGRTVRLTAVNGEKVQYACFQVLARIGSTEALSALGRLASATSNLSAQKRILAELEVAAGHAGVSVADLVETSQPDWGLDTEGCARLDLEGVSAILRLDDAVGATVTWLVEGKEVKRKPTEVVDSDAAAVKDQRAQLRKAAAVERGRLEGLFTSGREWPMEEFHRRQVEHPLVGWFARRLLWVISPVIGDVEVGIPTLEPGQFITARGHCEVNGAAIVGIWHPLLSTPEEVLALRDLLGREGIVQPFRQAWREVYRPDAVELTTGLHSSRFAGHVVRFHQLYALTRGRGWTGGYLSGAWDGGESTDATRRFESAGIQADWAIASFDPDPSRDYVGLAVTDRLVFRPIGEKESAPLPISGIPDIVFSETLRDLDLFISVSSVATDPLWLEKFAPGSQRIQEYWESMAAGGLADAVAHRREVLETLLSELPEADQLELEERQLVVRGVMRTYSIDLATANVKMEPPGRWLSIDTHLGAGSRFRPGPLPAVDDDVILGRIVSRARLLASDNRISNPSLLQQLRDR